MYKGTVGTKRTSTVHKLTVLCLLLLIPVEHASVAMLSSAATAQTETVRHIATPQLQHKQSCLY